MGITHKIILHVDAEEVLSSALNVLQRNPDLRESFLARLGRDTWDHQVILLADHLEVMTAPIKRGLKDSEKGIIDYGGNTSERYKGNRDRLRKEKKARE